MGRQVWDESRHAEIYLKLLEYVGSYYGEFPEGEVLWSCTQAEDAAARVAGINRGLEGLACDVFEQLIRLAQKMGDSIIERSVDYVLADEITHVRMGSKWMRQLTEGDPERLKRAQQFQDQIDELFNFGPGRKRVEDVDHIKQRVNDKEIEIDRARQVWDEARHSEIFQRLVEYMGAHPGDYVETEILWRCTQAMDPAARVAGINRGLEVLACDVFDQLIRIAQRNGDEVIERSVDYVLADEITHVRMGWKCMRKLTQGDPERLV